MRLFIPLLLLFASTASTGVTAPATRRVLFLHSLEHPSAPFLAFEETFRRHLGKESPEGVQFFEVSLQSAEADDQEAVLDYALSRFGKKHPDLIVPLGGPAAKFA